MLPFNTLYQWALFNVGSTILTWLQGFEDKTANFLVSLGSPTISKKYN